MHIWLRVCLRGPQSLAYYVGQTVLYYITYRAETEIRDTNVTDQTYHTITDNQHLPFQLVKISNSYEKWFGTNATLYQKVWGKPTASYWSKYSFRIILQVERVWSISNSYLFVFPANMVKKFILQYVNVPKKNVWMLDVLLQARLFVDCECPISV